MVTTAELPLPDDEVPAGLRYEVPLDSRPLVVERAPELTPVLARTSAGGFFEDAQRGHRVGAARNALHRAALEYAMSARPIERDDLAVALAGAAQEWWGLVADSMSGTGSRAPDLPAPGLTAS